MKQTKQGNVTVGKRKLVVREDLSECLSCDETWIIKKSSYERTLWRIVPGEGRVRGGKELGF